MRVEVGRTRHEVRGGAAALTVATVRSRSAATRAWSVTTPGLLVGASILLVLGTIAFGVVAVSAGASRHDAARGVATETEPLLVSATGIYGSLSDADATATTTFLTGGIESPQQHQAYVRDISSATTQLASLSTRVGSSAQAQEAVQTITQQLPVYTGLVDTARSNNRQDFPVGAAYLRDASSLMRNEILPAARQLYELEAARLDADYRSGTDAGALAAVVLSGLVLLVLLVITQVFVAHRSNRTFNVALVAATIVVVGALAWVVGGFVIEQRSLADARHDGSDTVQLLSSARINALRAQSDENLALIARGGDDTDLADFTTAMASVGGHDGQGGLIGEAGAIAGHSGAPAIVVLSKDFDGYEAAHRAIVRLERERPLQPADQ